MSGSGRSAAPSSNGGPGLDREPSHPFVRRLWAALRADYASEMNTTLRVAVMLADGLPRERIAERLCLGRHDLDHVVERLARVAGRIERDDETAPAIERHGVTS